MEKLTQRRCRFGPFDVDFTTSELRRNGVRRRLSGQPLQVLEMLIERNGEVVSREELHSRLWKDDTFVDFERGLNGAVNRLRDALGDSAGKPRYVETLPRLGYRFIGELIVGEVSAAAEGSVAFASNEVPNNAAYTAEPSLVGLATATLRTAAPAAWDSTRDQNRKWLKWTRHSPLDAKNGIVLADFENQTADPVFDDALRQGLFVGLEQSPFLRMVSDRKAAAILVQMGRSPTDRLVGPVALELCQRSDAKVVIEGSISQLGASYVVGLTAVRCDTGEPVAHEQANAKGKEQIIDALNTTTVHLRSRLGESVQSIEQYGTPLEQASTPSLEALKAYSQGFAVWDREGEEAAVPFFERAVELDPNFAMAYGALSAVYANQGETRLAKENAAKAYQLRSRVGELERTLIESWHDIYVTGDLERAAAVSELAVQTYPEAPRLLNDLGSIYGDLGHYDRAMPLLRKADQLSPGEATSVNLAVSLMALGRIEEAGSVFDEARSRHYSSAGLLQASYWLAFLTGDQGKMQTIVKDSTQVPGAQALLLCEQARSEAYHGHFRKANRLAHDSALAAGASNREAAGTCLAQEALMEAEAQDFPAARATIGAALRFSHEQGVTTLAALVRARTGDSRAALALANELSLAHPADTFVQHYWVPLIRAEIELSQNNNSDALRTLDAMRRMDYGAPGELESSTLYPAYTRGRAYLDAADGTKAAEEFQKLIDHPGMVLNFPLGTLSRVGLARAYERIGDTAKATVAYHEFLSLWKTADRAVPLRAEKQPSSR
jgi:eukaryotic-like serine/threonine-protein kinase